jgi:hypothetical protein
MSQHQKQLDKEQQSDLDEEYGSSNSDSDHDTREQLGNPEERHVIEEKVEELPEEEERERENEKIQSSQHYVDNQSEHDTEEAYYHNLKTGESANLGDVPPNGTESQNDSNEFGSSKLISRHSSARTRASLKSSDALAKSTPTRTRSAIGLGETSRESFRSSVLHANYTPEPEHSNEHIDHETNASEGVEPLPQGNEEQEQLEQPSLNKITHSSTRGDLVSHEPISDNVDSFIMSALTLEALASSTREDAEALAVSARMLEGRIHSNHDNRRRTSNESLAQGLEQSSNAHSGVRSGRESRQSNATQPNHTLARKNSHFHGNEPADPNSSGRMLTQSIRAGSVVAGSAQAPSSQDSQQVQPSQTLAHGTSSKIKFSEHKGFSAVAKHMFQLLCDEAGFLVRAADPSIYAIM